MSGFSDAANEARQHVRELRARDVEIALFGSIAVWENAGRLREWMEDYRRPPSDIDTVANKRHRRVLREYMDAAGFLLDERLAVASEGETYQFTHGTQCEKDVEVRFGALEFCHSISLNGCFHEQNGTIPLAELLLSKLLIIEVNATDVRDLLVLLSGLNDEAKHATTSARLTSHLNKDWGAWYTATRNLNQIPEWLADYGQNLASHDHALISSATHQLNTMLTDCRKTLRWRMRSLLGCRIRWYRSVAEKKDLF